MIKMILMILTQMHISIHNNNIKISSIAQFNRDKIMLSNFNLKVL